MYVLQTHNMSLLLPYVFLIMSLLFSLSFPYYFLIISRWFTDDLPPQAPVSFAQRLHGRINVDSDDGLASRAHGPCVRVLRSHRGNPSLHIREKRWKHVCIYIYMLLQP